VVGQAVALGKAPLNFLRGSGGEEKLLKNAKDACAAEMLEIATYTTLERLARAVGDDETARLAASIRADEKRMYERVLSELPQLAGAVVRADVNGEHAFDVSTTGAAETVRDAGKAARSRTRKPAASGRRKPAARRAAKKPARTRTGAARRDDLPIPGYDELTADQIAGRLASLSPRDRATIETHEREHKNRKTITNRIASLRPEEPAVAAARPRAADDREPAGNAGDLPEAVAQAAGEPDSVTATDGERRAAAAEGPREAGPVTGPGADLRAAADAGDSAAAFTLWERLRDTERGAAESYLRKAADSGDVRAAHRFGVLLWRERGNPEGAVEWLDRAAQANDPAAERDLGILLREHGDIRGAYHWLSRAADRDGEARHALADLVENR
jgi:hypothetical protein